ncbi:MAG: hypothetical protein IKG40_01330 [Bacilli bacterium]|nr:hypothetical protein [Bacilli bacterium]
MLNYFNVVQRHIGRKAIYNYEASRKRDKGIIKNTKYLNCDNWGKRAIGVHFKN